MEIMETTDPDCRSSIKSNGQDPERPSNLAFESTEDPYVPHRPGKYKARNVKPRNLRAKTERRNQKNNIIRCEEVTSRGYSNELAGLVMSLFGKP